MDLDRHGDRGNTLLYTACRGPSCSVEVVRALLQAGASPHVLSSRGSLPQHAIVSCFRDNSQDESLVERLVRVLDVLDAHYACFQSKNLDGRSAYDELLSCSASGLREVLETKLAAAELGFHKVRCFSLHRWRPPHHWRAADKCCAGSRRRD